MIALTIAIVALAGAGYAVFVARRTEAAVAELIEALPDDEEAEEQEAELPHIWVGDGECYVADMPAFLASINATAVCNYEGVPCAVIPGIGVISMHKLLSEPAKPRAVR